MNINYVWPRRRAEVQVNKYQAAKLGLEIGTIPCHVLGIYPIGDKDNIDVLCVCELHSGHCIYADPANVRYLDTDEKGDIIEC